MSDAKDGGPAFPSDWAPQGGQATQGMSLRDWFAGQALLGLRANPGLTDRGADWADFAHDAYGQADAMLKERARLETLPRAPSPEKADKP